MSSKRNWPTERKEPMNQAKPYRISKWVVWEAYKRVKANKGSYGVDEVSIQEFERKLKNNLYKIWNRMSSGSYFPPAVRQVEIPKNSGGKRPLGIPTVGDRIAQMVVKMELEPKVEPHFHRDSYGYRPKKSAIEAVGVARKRCWRYDWVVDVDIKGFFENLDHELLMKAVKKHTDSAWEILYIERWLVAPIELEDGTRKSREKGTPQGGVISPLLANLYLHYAFDKWMEKKYPAMLFERYADDIVVHCQSEEEAKVMEGAIRERLRECKLELNSEKTKIVYCKDNGRRKDYTHTKFDFLGYTFRARKAKNRWGKTFISFLPAASNEATTRIRHTMRKWQLHLRSETTIEEIARRINPIVRGWINYYGKYYRSELGFTFYCLNITLIRWAKRKYKRFVSKSKGAPAEWLGQIRKHQPRLFAHWSLAGQING